MCSGPRATSGQSRRPPSGGALRGREPAGHTRRAWRVILDAVRTCRSRQAIGSVALEPASETRKLSSWGNRTLQPIETACFPSQATNPQSFSSQPSRCSCLAARTSPMAALIPPLSQLSGFQSRTNRRVQYLPNLRRQFIRDEGLLNIRRTTGRRAPVGNHILRITGHQNHPQVWPQLPQLFGKGAPVHSGHHHVRQQQIDPATVPRKGGLRFRAVGGFQEW